MDSIWLFFKKSFNFKMGVVGGFCMGIAVFYINYYYKSFELNISLITSIKQFFYTLLLGGFFIKACEILSLKYKSCFKSLFLAILLPSIDTIILTYCIHLVKGTPDPIISTFPTFLAGPSAYIFWSIKTRWKYNKE